MASPFKIIILTLNLLFTQVAFGTGMSLDELLYMLKENKELGVMDAPMVSLARGTAECNVEVATPMGGTIEDLCNIAQKSDVSKKITDKSQLINCKHYQEEKSFNAVDLVVGCIKVLAA